LRKEGIMGKDKRESVTRIEAILKSLSVDVGVRLAGSEGEKLAAEFIRGELAASGATVTIEDFPVMERRVELERLEVRIGNSWQTFGCSLFSGTPGTDGRTLEAPIVFFASPTDYNCRDLSHLHGKAVVHLGCHIESRDHYRRLVEARPAFLLMVDIRYPGTEPLADGMFPSYTKDLGAVPTVNVAYMDAWNWKTGGAETARLSVKGGMHESFSQNVIAELPGRDKNAGIIVVGGHHDTLISFGAEEQLSVGSANYVRRHRADLAEHVRFMLNFDSIGSHLGWFELVANGPPEMGEVLLKLYEAKGLYMKLNTSAVPYADHFPFVAAGIPSAYLGRSNCTAGRFFHHRLDDNIQRVSPELLADVITASAEILTEFADTATIPFPNAIPEDQSEQIKRYWEDLFGGWTVKGSV
jgi:hypothetical protein